MELPNYSRQLMQQLRTLRKEGQFCDCTILVGDNPHNAHKLVLAASSMLFRSLLDGSDSISIDTAVVSSQVFTSLLDMVYSGKLPPGKHNLTHIIAAADSLQMFDVARGCRNILSDLMNHSAASNVAQPASATANIQAKPHDNSKAEETDCLQKTAHIPGRGDVKTACVPGRGGVKTSPPGAHMKNGVESEGQSGGVGGSHGESASEEVEQKGKEEPPCKKPRLQVLESSEHPFKQENTRPPAQDSRAAGLSAEERLGSSSVLLVHFSELLELLTGVPSIADLLTQAAHGSMGEPEKQTVLECCKEADPVSVVGGLLSSVRQGSLSEEALRTVLRAVQERAPSPSQRLLALLEGIQTHGPQEATLLEDRGSEAEKQGDRPQSSATVAPKTNEEEDKCTSEDEEGGEEDNQEDEQEEMGRGKRKPKPRPRESPTRTQPYHCRWCQKGFTYKCRMQAHAKRCSLSRDSQHQCPLCPELLPTPQALQKHRAQAHPDTGRAKKKVACELCGRAFAHLSGMLYHKRTEHFEEKPFACEECGAKFAANSSLKNHMRLHTGEKPYHCKHCDMSFSVAAALAYHTKKKHSEGKMYACQYCEALFAQSIELTRHVRTHTGDKPYVCRECGKGFSQANGLSVHLQTFHNISEPHDCQKCRLSFSSLEENRQHIQQCHPKEFHKCPACEKLFSSAALLEKHKTTHTGSKPYSCKLCHKSYQQLSGLWYHNRTNHPEVFAGQTHKQLKTLIQCDICLKFFPSANSLAKHQKAEHPEADGLVIGNADLSSDSSVVHCPYCPALFPSEEEMQEHASSQHFSQEDSAFGCSLCPLVCPSQLQLQEHFLSCHAGALEEQEECVEDPASAHAVIKTEDPDGVEAEHVISLDQSQLGGSQQVFVALGDGADGQSPSEVVAVNVDDLLNGTVTFICGDGQ